MDFGFGDLRDILRDTFRSPGIPPILPRSLFLTVLLFWLEYSLGILGEVLSAGWWAFLAVAAVILLYSLSYFCVSRSMRKKQARERLQDDRCQFEDEVVRIIIWTAQFPQPKRDVMLCNLTDDIWSACTGTLELWSQEICLEQIPLQIQHVYPGKQYRVYSSTTELARFSHAVFRLTADSLPTRCLSSQRRYYIPPNIFSIKFSDPIHQQLYERLSEMWDDRRAELCFHWRYQGCYWHSAHMLTREEKQQQRAAIISMYLRRLYVLLLLSGLLLAAGYVLSQFVLVILRILVLNYKAILSFLAV